MSIIYDLLYRGPGGRDETEARVFELGGLYNLCYYLGVQYALRRLQGTEGSEVPPAHDPEYRRTVDPDDPLGGLGYHRNA